MIDDQVDANDIEGMAGNKVFGAVAEFGQLEMGIATELEAGGDENRVNLNAGGTGKFKVQFGAFGSLGGAGEDPAATGEQRSGKIPNEALRIVGTERSKLQVPGVGLTVEGKESGVSPIPLIDRLNHTALIGQRECFV